MASVKPRASNKVPTSVANTRIRALLRISRSDMAGAVVSSRCRGVKRPFMPLSGMIWISSSGASSIRRSVRDALWGSIRWDMPLRPRTIFVTPDRRENSAI